MKNFKFFLILLGIVILCHNFALATEDNDRSGTGDSGGGNGLKGQMIEEYLVMNPLTDLPDFNEAIQTFIERLNMALPELSEEIAKTSIEQDWYLIPKKIRELPEKVTGLHFESDQVAYQNGKEIFIDQDYLLQMKKESRIVLYKHEALMAALQLPSESTRILLAFMKKNPNFTGEELREKMYNLAWKDFAYNILTTNEHFLISSLQREAEMKLPQICHSNLNLENKYTKLQETFGAAYLKWVAYLKENEVLVNTFLFINKKSSKVWQQFIGYSNNQIFSKYQNKYSDFVNESCSSY